MVRKWCLMILRSLFGFKRPSLFFEGRWTGSKRGVTWKSFSLQKIGSFLRISNDRFNWTILKSLLHSTHSTSLIAAISQTNDRNNESELNYCFGFLFSLNLIRIAFDFGKRCGIGFCIIWTVYHMTLYQMTVHQMTVYHTMCYSASPLPLHYPFESL